MQKKMNTMTLCHVILMGILVVLSCVSAGIIFSGHIPEGYGIVTDAQKNASFIIGLGHAVNALALICGMVYLLKGSGKNVAGLYKAFLMLVALGQILRLIGKLVFPGFDAIACLIIACIVLLLILSFVKDLGKTRTQCAYYILLALELALAVLLFDSREALSSIASGLTRLVLAGSIGIAIWEKYKDKAARGK